MIPQIYVAIDTPDISAARALIASVAPLCDGVKLGLEFFAAHGPAGVRAVMPDGLPLFLDVKLHDIPNTVGKAMAALAPLAPAIVTVHAAGGAAMLGAAREAAGAATKVVAVTVLTSLDDGDLGDIGIGDGAGPQVARLAGLARDAGLAGIVCSAREAAAVRAGWPDCWCVVPGIRPDPSADAADQKRAATPADAAAAGASVLVIGRPVTGARDQRRALEDIAASLRH